MPAPMRTVGRLMGADNMIVVVAGLKSSWMDADIQLRSVVFMRCLFVRSQSGVCFWYEKTRADVGGNGGGWKPQMSRLSEHKSKEVGRMRRG